jgi:hypothetical protein
VTLIKISRSAGKSAALALRGKPLGGFNHRGLFWEKVTSKLGLDFSRLGKRCLTTVARVRLWG